jgi:CelD/BcsL family acetyltransferase involved in cellulose biosynthesis
MALRSEIVGHPGQVDRETRLAWDALAVAAGRPCRLSAWLLAAAEHLHDEPPLLILLRDDGRLVGVAAFVRNRWTGPLWIESVLQVGWNFGHGIGPLAAPGYEAALAREIAARLPALVPDVSMVTIAWDDLDSPWPRALSRCWAGRLHRRLEASQVCPVVTMAESHEAWRAGRSRNFRETIRRKTRAIERRGGRIRRSDDPDRVARDIAEMVEVHRARFDALSKPSNLTDRHRDALIAAAPDLLRGGHLRLWALEYDGRVAAAQVHVRAGDGMYFYNGGMAPGWEREAPGLVLLDAAVADAHAIGARTLDLGPGAFPYKLRFSDTQAVIGSHDLFVLDRRYPLVRARLARKHLATAAARRAAALPAERRAQLKRLLRRGRRT